MKERKDWRFEIIITPQGIQVRTDMRLPKKVEQAFRNDTFKQSINWILNSSLSALLAILFVWIFNDRTVILVGLAVILVFALILTNMVYAANNTFNLIGILRRDQKKGNWREIIRIAYPLSRPLWLSRNYKLRIELGRLIDDACIHLDALSEKTIIVNDKSVSIKSIRSSILIDDLGWTLYKINSRLADEAKDNITNGISIAEKEKDYSKVIKGYRHLSGISSELNGSYESIDSYHRKILMVAESGDYLTSTPVDEQLATKATLNYALARQKLRAIQKEKSNEDTKPRLAEVIELIGFCEDYFKHNDPNRFAKTFCVRAEAYMMENTIEKLNTAKDLLKTGLLYCKDQQRRDNYIRISIALLKVDLQRLNLRKFQKEELDLLRKETKAIYSDVLTEIAASDDEDNYKSELKNLIRDIRKKCKENNEVLLHLKQ